MAEATADTTLPAVPGSALVDGFSSLSIVRQVGLMVGLAASVAMGFAVVLWSQEPNYQPLARNLAARDTSEIVEVLAQNQVQYRIDPSTGDLLVPADKIHQIRMQLAAADIQLERVVGLEVLDKEQGLGTSQFMETARYRRGLEGELARTISSLKGVRNARVHIAVPRRSVFVRDSRKPSASVVLELYSGAALDPRQILGVVNLVANSIPELEKENVSVVDQNGRLISDHEEDKDMAAAAKQFEFTRRYEEVLTRRVSNVLTPILGLDHFKAEVTADLDFTVVEQTAEHYNPDLPALRSEQRIGEQRVGDVGAGGVPGALSNQPPGGSNIPETLSTGGGENPAIAAGKPGSNRSQVTRNFELDRTISHTRHDSGRLRRLSVAVVVDDLPAAEGARSAWTDEDLARVTALVKDAVGFDISRGDSINIINRSFAPPPPPEEIPPTPIWEEPWVWELGKQVLGALFVLLLVFAVLRPMLKSLAASPAAQAAGGGLGGLDDMEGGSGFGQDDEVTLSGGDNIMLPSPDEGYQAQLNAIRGLVAENPGRVAQVVKHMINADD